MTSHGRKKGKKFDEDRMLLKEEEMDKARRRTRGPYRKSSRIRSG